MRILFVFVTVSVSSSPALADWQYTRWGMTAQQVVAASRGAAKQNTDGEATRDPNYRTLLIAPYSVGHHRFMAHFIFDADTMHGFGAFFFVIGVLVLLFSPVVGILLMILGLIMMGAGAARRKEIRQAAAEAARVPCPHCAELIGGG